MKLIIPELTLFVCEVLFRKHHSRTDVDRHRLTELQIGNTGPPVRELQRYIHMYNSIVASETHTYVQQCSSFFLFYVSFFFEFVMNAQCQ